MLRFPMGKERPASDAGGVCSSNVYSGTSTHPCLRASVIYFIEDSRIMARAHRLHTERALVPLNQTDFTDVALLVISVEDARSGMLAVRRHTSFAHSGFHRC